MLESDRKGVLLLLLLLTESVNRLNSDNSVDMATLPKRELDNL